eukprot:TRINITY_DN1247_c0_g1_i3.p1 TRINITY_DN1247_c0_g1~~TRINITY_DN1247_c0_g1_i3.p1  ORF type:complete len:486 (-),score=145.77 TRINITY_DN1247_c0_g1_i3:133-1590(-)
MSKGQFTMDNLKLASSTEVLNMLKKKGTEDEYILFSGIVDKVNRRGKHQTRVLLITNRAIYNLAENYKCKRRIAMEDVESMNIDQSQDEVVINVPKEYEYKFISDMREQIAVVLVQAVENYEKRKLQVTRTGSEHDKKEEETPIWRGEKVSLKDFSVLKLLGKGAFGEVYQVKKKDSGNVYAMKILSKQFIADNQKIEHTMVERTILAVFDNPFIMTLRFAFQTKTKLYLVMDYYHGGMLLSHLDKAQRFTEDQARFIVAEVACALGHLHSCNFIYRDLKPDNILMDLDGHICLTDFGLAKQVDPNNPYATTFVGTPDYIAPEIINQQPHGPAVDWWSLGVLLYELVIGRPPFNSDNINTIFENILNTEPIFPDDIPISATCKHLITRLLIKDPTERLGSGDADVEDIIRHTFFDSIDFDKLLDKEAIPAYQPQTSKDKSGASDPLAHSFKVDWNYSVGGNTGTLENNDFKGFTFVNSGGVSHKP